MKIYNFIEPGLLPSEFRKVSEFLNFNTPSETYYVYAGREHLVINSILKGNKPGVVDKEQIEIPIEACAWIADVIENGFWKLPSEGGLPRNKHGVTAKFAEEEVGVSRSMNAGTDQPGFRIVNKSRKSPGLEFFWPQSISFADTYFEKYLLSIFRSL